MTTITSTITMRIKVFSPKPGTPKGINPKEGREHPYKNSL
jgi:hypothetical protein